MKIIRALILLVAFCVFAVALAYRIYPPISIVFARGITVRSSFCSVWQAVRDGNIKLRQQAVTQQLLNASHSIKQEPGLTLWTTPAGEFWVPEGDGQIIALLLAQEQREIYGGEGWGVRAGDVVLDCGAYVGTTVKQALSKGAKLVIAIEPSPSSVECLRRNLAGEIAAGKVIVYPKGIWDSEGALTLHTNGSSGVGNSFVEEGGTAADLPSIPVTTIDKLVAELRLQKVDFIKADVKGATQRLLKGAAGVIQRDRPRLALSTEESVDDAPSVARAAKGLLPAYEMKCGPCLLDSKEIYTDVLFFR